MAMPKTVEECEQRAHAVARKVVEKWKARDQTEQHVYDFEEDVYQEAYGVELDELRALLDMAPWGSGIDSHAHGLIGLSRRLRFEFGAPSTIGIAVATLIKTAEEHYDHSPDVALVEMVAALVEIFGADKVRAAIDQTD